jgi:sialate O-acetylesterase
MKRSVLLACGVFALLAPSASADVKVPSVFASHMVVQRDKPLVVWGTADKGESVTVSFGGKDATAKADDDGKWKVTLPKFEANAKAQKMTIKGNNTLELEDVLVGDVWLGSGQSNMEWPLSATDKSKQAIDDAKHPNIRLMHVKKVSKNEPQKDVVLEKNGAWTACTPESARNFSAVLYFFGVRLQKDLDVPIGLINSSWGGSAIQPWTVEGKTSGGMYNAMIAPLQPVALKGIIWYQGESNMSEGMKYRDRKEALIKGWRKTFGQEDLPFYFVQIAPFSGYGKNSLPDLWEAQTACLKIANTGMAVTTDITENVGDIHPRNKRDVGDRLALWALAKAYGKKDVVYSGPLYKSMKVDGGKVRLSFAHVGGGLKSRDGKALSEFEIAGEDGKFVPAEATIDGKEVVVQSKDVEKPTQVRFGWRNVANPNLSNKEGLPAGPFRTKDWKGGTGE